MDVEVDIDESGPLARVVLRRTGDPLQVFHSSALALEFANNCGDQVLAEQIRTKAIKAREINLAPQ